MDSWGTDAQVTRGQDTQANSAKGASRRKSKKQHKTSISGRSCADACQALESKEATRPSGTKAAVSEDERESFSSGSRSVSPEEARPARSGNWRRQRQQKHSPIASSASSSSSSERESSRRRAGAHRREKRERWSQGQHSESDSSSSADDEEDARGRSRARPQVNHCLGASGSARALRERAGQSANGASGARNLGTRNQQLVASRIRRRLVRTGLRLRRRPTRMKHDQESQLPRANIRTGAASKHGQRGSASILQTGKARTESATGNRSIPKSECEAPRKYGSMRTRALPRLTTKAMSREGQIVTMIS